MFNSIFPGGLAASPMGMEELDSDDSIEEDYGGADGLGEDFGNIYIA
jgi:hypothetical protein